MYENVKAIIESGKLSGFRGYPEGHSGGYWVQKLEESFREYFNIKHAVSMNSATACLHSALVACGVTPQDYVGVTPYTFSSSVSCVKMVNATPHFIDVDSETFCMNPRFATTEDKAIIPVHLMGHPANMDKMPKGIKIIEDAAQAIGAKYNGQLVGTIGDCGIFSFNQSKQINTGEGGMLITNDDYIARVAKAMRNHGEVSDPELGIVGYNYRLCEIEAYMAYEQFKSLDTNLEYRNDLAMYMTEKLSQIEGFVPPVVKKYCTRHSWYTYGVKYLRGHRDRFQKQMMEHGVYFGSGYVKPLYLLPIYGYKEGLCPVTEKLWRETLCVFDWLKFPATTKTVDKAIETIKTMLG